MGDGQGPFKIGDREVWSDLSREVEREREREGRELKTGFSRFHTPFIKDEQAAPSVLRLEGSK